MHLLRTDSVDLGETAQAVDLEQSAAELVFLSFTDSDLAAVAAAWERDEAALPSLRLASLAQLKHPFSVDLYLEKVAAKARFVLVRLLGGMDYWRYGVEELASLARARGFALAIVPGDYQEDARLDAASTLPVEQLRRLWRYFQEGGPGNMRAALGVMAGGEAAEPEAVAAFGVVAAPPLGRGCDPASPKALILFYRSVHLAADTAPVEALAAALQARGLAATCAYVSSLKDTAAAAPLAAWIARERPDVILNTTAFSARLDEGGGVLDAADAPVLQVILAGSRAEQWAAASRGLSAADLAMNVVLPEIDGRIVAGAISFKAETARREKLEFSRIAHHPDASRISHVADLAAAWTRLRRTAAGERRLACVLSDYPGKSGRGGYAVGLDTPASVAAIAEALRGAGYDVAMLPPEALMRHLTEGAAAAVVSPTRYRAHFATLPQAFREPVLAAWGDPADDATIQGDAFHFRFLRAGKLIVALQPNRGRAKNRRDSYHDTNLPPCHGYIAFYLWLREIERIDAMIHCGTHGTLEWLPGKSVALSDSCAPEVLLGPVPVVYPFIVNNPGEAAQAKRRLGAVTVGHLTPPLTLAGQHGAAAEMEGLFDEYAQAQVLDPRRAKLLAQAILARAEETGLIADAGASGDDPLAALDSWLCDLKEMRIRDGLHVFGGATPAPQRAAMLDILAKASAENGIAAKLDACAAAEMAGLLAALDGRFVQPGPAGAPAQGRLDVLPTGRNLFTVDPRGVPTRTAWEIGRRTAAEICARHAQDHGEWPRRIVLDLWASASMRTGGDDLAQAYALLGVRPRWDAGSNRVAGFDILPLASLERARVDVTLRISGLFRDVFPEQIALFDAAVRAVAALDEDFSDNPLAEQRADAMPRIFGAAPGGYGIGLGRVLDSGDWQSRADLGEAYLAATSHAYGAGEGEAAAAFRAQVASADAFVHVQDMDGQDVLDSDAFAEHEGGFAAAAETLGNRPAIYHADTTRAGKTAVRTLREEVARVLRGRATNPRWLAGQMRHGFRGAAEIAGSVDNLFAYAATTDAVESCHFDLMFDATCGNDAVRAFLLDANPQAADAIAQKFEEAARRGFWSTRRNSAGAILAEMRRAA